MTIIQRFAAMPRPLLLRSTLLLCLAAAPAPVCAQRATAAPAQAAAAPAPAPVPVITEQSANDTRDQFNELLQQHPPALREVFQRDPALLANTEYLAPYPRITSFLAAHPEIVRSPAYFVGEWHRSEPEPQGIWMFREMMSMVAVGTLLLMAGLSFAWLIRTALDHRRWQRVSKVQVETHSKVLDRMTSSDELRAYMESPAGRRFLESAPIALDGKAAPISAPLNRILWSIQVGVVALLGGLALQYVSSTVIADAGQPLRVLGVFLAAIGAGFLISAGLSYALSRHLGLFKADADGTMRNVPQV
ncbi:MAG TPA: hypothetical protein VMF13_19620 [Luteitalea sp.]|nr:hypothetical protein [Luteitalea sp.]